MDLKDVERNQYEQDRLSKLEKIRALGFDPYGSDKLDPSKVYGVGSFFQAATSLRAGCMFQNQEDGKYIPDLSLSPTLGQYESPCFGSGRIVLRRPMGNLHFLTVRDDTGDIQVAINKKSVSEKEWGLAKLLDLGDIINFSGKLAPTKAGEPTLWAISLRMSCKAIAVPPSKVEGLQDIEQRYRKRYVDLWSNVDVMKTMKTRSMILGSLRTSLYSKSFDEVETPILQNIPGGAAATPFKTHHNALDIPLYMRIAPELYLKRLLVGGFSNVFEIGRNFRNEGVSTKHNPEFTALEAYQAYGTYESMMDLSENLIKECAKEIAYRDEAESKLPTGKWRRVTLETLVREKTATTFDIDPSLLTPEFFFKIYQDTKLEETIIEPTFITHLPSSAVPLAKSDGEGHALAFELVINGMEIGCGYTEQSDPVLQLEAFQQQTGSEKQIADLDFIDALKVGMPPAGGLGIGVDRLVMILTGQSSIRDVILFPLLKPEN